LTRIKICGLRTEADIACVNEAFPDYCGFIIDFPKSFRSITPERAAELIRGLRLGIVPVGIFVDAPIGEIVPLAQGGILGAVQLHGGETPEYIEELQREIRVPVIRAFTVRSDEDLRLAEESPAEIILLDNGKGTGRTFDWSILRHAVRPYILAGGLGPENLAQAIGELRPWGVDMSSGVETDRKKDRDKILAAVRIAHNL
jgi:phosphoribosylanthranilate isomerase